MSYLMFFYDFRPQKDIYYDMDRERNESEKEEEKKKIQARQSKIMNCNSVSKEIVSFCSFVLF